jgi:hypothetical protein
MGAWGVFVAIPLLGIASVAAIALGGSECLPIAGRFAQWTLVVLVPMAAALLGWSAQTILAIGLPTVNRETAQ